LLQDSIALAVEALSWMELEGLSERQALILVSKQLQIHDGSSMRLAFRLMTETTRRLNLVDYIADWALDPRKLGDWNLGVRNFLRLYIYWAHFRKRTFKGILSFLESGRRVLGRDELLPVESAFGMILAAEPKKLIANERELTRMSLETCHTEWFVRYSFRLLGRDDGLRLLNEDYSPPPTYLRINSLRQPWETVIEEIKHEGVTLSRMIELRDAWKVERTEKPLIRLRSYERGLFQIQDISSQAACQEANPKPGDFVLDICAAPGIKTCSLAQIMNNKGTVVSLDIAEARMRIWKSEIKRMGVEIAQPIICDVQRDLPLNVEADVVLVDPPCSSTGLYAKSPSMKWRMKSGDVEKLSSLQLRILDISSQHVKKTGSLVYSTCSILLEENELVIEQFLKAHPTFKISPTSMTLGSEAFRGLNEARRFYPHKDHCNGFFVAKMEREN
jgi:16S rRNA (cytosine967-C5)-methyltransferase